MLNCVCLLLIVTSLNCCQWVITTTWNFIISLYYVSSFYAYMCKASFRSFLSDSCVNLALSNSSISLSMFPTQTLLIKSINSLVQFNFSSFSYLSEKHQIYILYQKSCMKKKNFTRELCKKHLNIFLIKLCRIQNMCRKGSFLLL